MKSGHRSQKSLILVQIQCKDAIDHSESTYKQSWRASAHTFPKLKCSYLNPNGEAEILESYRELRPQGYRQLTDFRNS